MSKFLGPIHYWLYNKIIIQESMVQAVLDLNKEKQYTEGLAEQVNASCGIIEKKSLEDIIDTENIHGWLQGRIEVVERRLSFVVTAILKDDQSRLNDILEAMEIAGRKALSKIGLDPSFDNAEEVYTLLNDILLDGMPCDHINECITSGKDEVVFRRTRCIHEAYWLAEGGIIINYYDIRNAFIKGILDGSGFSYSFDQDGYYHIRRTGK